MILSVLLCAGQAFAQSTVTGGINGRVTDPQGAIVPNATVKVTNTGTNAEVTVMANDDGVYRVSNLNPGTYRVEFSAGSFAPSKADNVVVEVGRATSIDAQLTVGTAVAEVEVSSEAPVLNTSDNSNTTSIQKQIRNDHYFFLIQYLFRFFRYRPVCALCNYFCFNTRSIFLGDLVF